MTFLFEKFVFIIGAIILAIFLFIYKNEINKINNNLLCFFKAKTNLIWLIIIFFIFWFFCYFYPDIYYTPWTGATLGDNFLYLLNSFNNNNYYYQTHLFYPFVPFKIYELFKKFNLIFNENDPDFMFKIIPFFSLPVKLFSLIGLLYAYKILKKITNSIFEQILGMFFIAVTFAFWLWSIQPNGRGLAISFSFVVIYYLIKLSEDLFLINYIIIGLLCSMAIFIHIGLIYFIIGVALIVCFYSIRKYYKIKNNKLLLGVFIFIIINSIFLIIYYFLLVYKYNTYSLSKLIYNISEPWNYGAIKLGMNFFKLFFIDSIGSILGMLLGVQYKFSYKIKPLYEDIILMIQLGIILNVLSNVIFLKFKKIAEQKYFLIIFFSFVFTLIGFSIRKTWINHYNLIIPAITLLILFFSFNKSIFKDKLLFHLQIIILIITMFYINGFGFISVLHGNNYKDNILYNKFNLLKYYTQNKKTILYENDLDDWTKEQIYRYATETKISLLKNITLFTKNDIEKQILQEFYNNYDLLITPAKYTNKILYSKKESIALPCDDTFEKYYIFYNY
ncbi:MAG: hypothetical protein A2096_06380 [Spirochaetes bacterium GWF1_41_5]|nr:MAG: hypothetical protein A2096_06380 [Spirochaetes bacterium GWF1_41_5]